MRASELPVNGSDAEASKITPSPKGHRNWREAHQAPISSLTSRVLALRYYRAAGDKRTNATIGRIPDADASPIV